MADSSPIVTSQMADDAAVYRPISGFAVAGLALSALCAASVVISAVAGDFFLAGLIIILAILGVSLSVLAMWRIWRAEGTRAGLKVAQWGLWLGLISGGGYAVFYAVTILAIKMQANHFLMDDVEDSGFFPKLQKNELKAAFLLTQTFARRTGGNSHDDEAMRRQFDTPQSPSPTGLLTQFLNSNVVRVFQQAFLEGKPAIVEPMGIRAVEYTALGPKVARYYHVATAEASMDLVVVVQSTENDSSGQGRKWFVVWSGPEPTALVKPIGRTPLGQHMVDLRIDSANALDKWIDQGAGRQLGNLAPKVVVKDARVALADQEEVIADFQRTLERTPANKLHRMIKVSDANFAFWTMTDDGKKLRITHSFSLTLLGDEGPAGFRYMGYGRCLVETPVPGDPRTTEFKPDWRLVEVVLDRALPIPRGR